MSRSVYFGRNFYNLKEVNVPLVDGEELHRAQTRLFCIDEQEILEFIEDMVNQIYTFTDGVEYDLIFFKQRHRRRNEFEDVEYNTDGLMQLMIEHGYNKEAEMLDSLGYDVYFEVF